MSTERDELANVIAETYLNNMAAGPLAPKLTNTDLAEDILVAGYRRPRTITTVEEIKDLPALAVVLYDDTANGGLMQAYVVPDDGTVMFKDRYPFHLMTFAGDYIQAEDIPLPLRLVYEANP